MMERDYWRLHVATLVQMFGFFFHDGGFVLIAVSYLAFMMERDYWRLQIVSLLQIVLSFSFIVGLF
jgi:hypothetical protein